MMKRIILAAIALIFVVNINAQHSITGKVLDDEGMPLNYATVALLNQGDSILKYFGISNKEGVYQIKSVKEGNYIMQFSFVGKQMSFENISIPNEKGDDFGDKTLLQESIGEVTVIGEYIPIEFKSDTVEFNSKAFATKQDAVVEDLLKKIPGVEVDNSGNIKALGEDVTKILVDGKEFFGNDPKVATKNLPANAVDKVQIYDKRTEEAEFMGIDDGVRDRTINILLNPDNKKGYFGDIEAGAGYSDQIHYKADAKLYRFSDKLQTAFLGMYNNINEFGYSGKGHNWGRTINGVNTTGAGGINLSYNATKYNRYFISYLGQSTNTILEQSTITQNFSDLGNYSQESEKESDEIDAPHKVNFGIRHNFNKRNNFTLDGNVGYTYNNLENTLTTLTQLDGTSINNLNNTESILGNTINADAKGVYILKLNEEKSQIKTNITGSFSRNISENSFENITTFFDPLGGETINQFQNLNTEKLNLSADPTFVQQLSKFWYINANANLGLSNEHNLREQGNLTDNTPIASLGTDFFTKNMFVEPALSIQRNTSKLQLNLTLGSAFEQLDRNATTNTDAIQNYSHFLPSFSLASYYDKGKRLNLKYNTSVNMPSVTQLDEAINTINPLSLYQGNMALTPEYKHNANLSWSIFDQFSFTSFFSRIGASYTQNKISTARTINADFTNLITPINVDYYYQAYGFMYFSTPIRALGIKINIKANENYSKGLNIINDVDNVNTSFTHSINLSIENRNKEKWDLLVGGSVALTDSKYSISENMNNVYYNTSYFTQIDYNPTDNWSFETEANMMNYSSKSFGESISIPLVSAGVSYYFKNWKKASLKLEVKDALNKSENIYQISEANYLMQQTSNTIGRLVMLSFKMKLGKY